MGKEGNSHLKSISCQALLIHFTMSSYWGGIVPIHHLKGLFQSLKVDKNATKITRSCLAGFFMGKEGAVNQNLSPVRFFYPLTF